MNGSNCGSCGAGFAVQSSLSYHAKRWVLPVLTAVGLIFAKGMSTFSFWISDAELRWSAASFEFFLLAAGVIIASLVGGLTRSHEREALSQAESKAAKIDAEQARLAEARLSERARIAREMHDVVAHRISLIAMHAGVLAHTSEKDEVREEARLIQTNARDALVELRTVLADLRGATSDPEPPQPTLADLPALLSDAQSAGQQIEINSAAQLDNLPAQVGRQTSRARKKQRRGF